MYNRQLQRLTIERQFNVALTFIQKLSGILPSDWLDVEGLERRHGIGRGTLIVLDNVTRTPSYAIRKEMLSEYIPLHLVDQKPAEDSLLLAPSFAGDSQLYARLQEINADWGVEFYEGIVSKEADSPYVFQSTSASKESHHWMKHRFI